MKYLISYLIVFILFGCVVKAQSAIWDDSCKGAIGFTLPPCLVGDHLPNCYHQKYVERERAAQMERINYWEDQFKMIVKIPVECNHIWVEEYGKQVWNINYHSTVVVCVKCYKEEERKSLNISPTYGGYPYQFGLINTYVNK